MKDIQKEITPISNDDLFIVLNHPDAKFDYPIHYHSDFELNLVLNTYVWGIERSGFFNGRGKWAKGFENQRV